MTRAEDQVYFSRRFTEEMDCGDHAVDASIAAIHYELAHRYAFISSESPAKPHLALMVGGREEQPAEVLGMTLGYVFLP